jgi:predicted DNA-binding transcriptional regulator AlpA
MMEQGRFPRPVKLSERVNVWPDNEVDAWIAERIAAREAEVA